MSEYGEIPAGLKLLDKVSDAIVLVCKIVTGVALVGMTLSFGWLVFGRYVLGDTPTWVDPLSLLLVMVIAFLGAAVGVREDTHLSVVIFRQIVPNAVRTVLVVITDVIMAGFGFALCWWGYDLTKFKWATKIPLLQWSEGLRTLPLTICGALVFLFSVGHLIRLFMGRDERVDSIE